MRRVASPKSPQPMDTNIDLEEELQDLAFRAADGDRLAGELLEKHFQEHDVMFDDQHQEDNPSFRQVDSAVQTFKPVQGFNRN